MSELTDEEEIFIDLYKSSLTYVEIQTALNCGKNKIDRLVRKFKLKREKPKADYMFRYGEKNCRLSRVKSTRLRKCLNPKCDFYYYGHKNDRYCCKKCANYVSNKRSEPYRKKWIEKNREYLREYERKRRQKKSRCV